MLQIKSICTLKLAGIFIGVMILQTACSFAAAGQSGFPIPEKVLAKSDSALQSLETLSYQAENFTVGVHRHLPEPGVSPPARAQVEFRRLDAEDALGTKIAVRGNVIGSFSIADQAFEIVYDGQRIIHLDPTDETAYTTTPEQTGSQLLSQFYNLILWEFMAGATVQVFDNDSLAFDGFAVVEGIECLIIYSRHLHGSRTIETRWFIGQNDYLPRKIWRKHSGIPGQVRTEVVTFTDVRADLPLDSEAFALDVPAAYTVKEFQGPGGAELGLSIGEEAPQWSLTDASDKRHSFEDYLGRVVIMDFWATWCGACLVSMPKLQRLHEQFPDDQVAVLGINIWESGDPVAYMQRNDYTYGLLTAGDELAKQFKVTSLPTLYVIDPEGRVLYGIIGSEIDYEKISRLIKGNIETSEY